MNNALNLIGRILLAALFLPAGLSKLSGFEGTVGYIASVGLPLPAVGAAAALTVEILGSVALILGFQTRIAAAVLALVATVAIAAETKGPEAKAKGGKAAEESDLLVAPTVIHGTVLFLNKAHLSSSSVGPRLALPTH